MKLLLSVLVFYTLLIPLSQALDGYEVDNPTLPKQNPLAIIVSNSSGGGGSGGFDTTNVCFTNNSQTFTGLNTFSGNVTLTNLATISGDEKIFNGYNPITNIVQLNVYDYLKYQGENRKDSYFNHTLTGDVSNVTILRSGFYTIHYDLCINFNADVGSLDSMETRLVKNGVLVPLAGSLSYNKGDPAQSETICVSKIIEQNLTAGDKVAVQLFITDALGATASQTANASSFHVRYSG